MNAAPKPTFDEIVAPPRCYSFVPRGGDFEDDVRSGLAAAPKSLRAQWSFDPTGLRLFAELSEVAEFYPVRAELSIMQGGAAEIATLVGPDALLVSAGTGGLATALSAISRLKPALVVHCDADITAVEVAVDTMANLYPATNMVGMAADLSANFELPRIAGVSFRRKVALVPQWALSGIGRERLPAFLRNLRRVVGAGGVLLVGVCLKDDRKIIHNSCNDSDGAMARFNGNVLARINRMMAADFNLAQFAHVATYDDVRCRVEFSLKSLLAQRVCIEGQTVSLAAGEAIRTGFQDRYADSDFLTLATDAGFESKARWIDAKRRVSLHGLVAA